MPHIFNRNLVKIHKNRFAARAHDVSDFLHDTAAERLIERLDGFVQPDTCILVHHSRCGAVAKTLLKTAPNLTVIEGDIAFGCVQRFGHIGQSVVMDNEQLPVREASMDGTVSCLGLHTVNDVPIALRNYHQTLKAGGFFVGSLLGGRTLQELRNSIAHAASEKGLPMTPRVAPMIDTKTAGQLLAHAGFIEPVADAEHIEVEYSSAFDLLFDLHHMAEGNVLVEQHQGLTTARQLQLIVDSYHHLYGDAHGKITASFDIISLTGWKKT